MLSPVPKGRAEATRRAFRSSLATTTFRMFPETFMSNTIIGSSFSRQRAMAVWSITRRFFWIASSKLTTS